MQRTLLSWAEFPGLRRGRLWPGEPVKPKGRGRKAEPSPSPLFEWVLNIEQEREKEPA